MSCEGREIGAGQIFVTKAGGKGEKQVKRGRVVGLCWRCVCSGGTRFSGSLTLPAGAVLGCRTRQTPETPREGSAPGNGGRQGL